MNVLLNVAQNLCVCACACGCVCVCICIVRKCTHKSAEVWRVFKEKFYCCGYRVVSYSFSFSFYFLIWVYRNKTLSLRSDFPLLTSSFTPHRGKLQLHWYPCLYLSPHPHPASMSMPVPAAVARNKNYIFRDENATFIFSRFCIITPNHNLPHLTPFKQPQLSLVHS